MMKYIGKKSFIQLENTKCKKFENLHFEINLYFMKLNFYFN